MPRLVSFDLQRGVRLRIHERDFSIIDVPQGAATIKLQEDGTSETLVVSRGELARLVVTEEAEFIDDPAEPPPIPSRAITDISHLPPMRMLDWHAKVYIVLRMRRFCGQSPKSVAFRKAFEQANQALAEFYAEMGLPLKTWSDWHIYHDLLRWRANRFEWFAFQRKGVPQHGVRKRQLAVMAEFADGLDETPALQDVPVKNLVAVAFAGHGSADGAEPGS